MILAIILVLLTVGSVLFHFLSPWYLTPIASNWQGMDDALTITFVITGAVFVAVNLFLAYAVFRYRKEKTAQADYEPENKTLEGWLTGLTAIGVVAMLAPGLIVWADYVEVPEDAAVIEALAQQWQWAYRFPGADGVLGTTAIAYIDGDNPFGMNPEDPYGKDDVLIEDSELHIPVGSPLKIVLRSKDVLHNFYIPQIRAKMDVVPGLITYFWFTPTRTGEFEILCAEYCGISHYNMRGSVFFDEPAVFDSWLAEQPTYADMLAEMAPADEPSATMPTTDTETEPGEEPEAGAEPEAELDKTAALGQLAAETEL